MVQIITCNSIYDKNNKWVDGYHEIHEITNIKSYAHFIATIESIINLNLKFKNDDSVIDRLIISCDDTHILNQVVQYYKDNPSLIDIQEVESYMSLS